VPVLDSHTHLDIVGDDPADQIAAATAVGVDRLVQVGVDRRLLGLGGDGRRGPPGRTGDGRVAPQRGARLARLDEALREIESMAAHPRVRGIGETGLDHFRTGADGRAAQEHSFRAHIAIAKRYAKTLVIHDRDRPRRRPAGARRGGRARPGGHALLLGRRRVRHRVRQARLHAELRRHRHVRQRRPAARGGHAHPARRDPGETDAPYLTAMPYRGRPNGSYLIPLTVRALAETTGTDLATMCAAISANGERMFGPWLG
jgi:TatD DNase family protein